MKAVVESKDISVVVQGKLDQEYSKLCIESIRKYFPESQIILSTWKGENYLNSDFDDLVLSEDPGMSIQNSSSGIPVNLNRQIVSTREGIKRAERKYVLKVRSDIKILDNHFLERWSKFTERDEIAKTFKNRILICNYYTRNPRIISTPYHYSDWIAFGLKEDIEELYDIPLQNREESEWFLNHSKKTLLYQGYLCRYSPEQYITLNAARKKRQIDCDNYYDLSKRNMKDTEYYLVNNYVIFNMENNIEFQKYNPNRYGDQITLLNEKEWEILYQRYLCKKRDKLEWCIYRGKSMCKRMIAGCLFEAGSYLTDKLGIKNKLRLLIAKSR